MPNQPSPVTRISTAACVYLTVAAIAGAFLAAIIYVEMTTTLESYRGAPAALAALVAVGGCGYIIRSAEDRVASSIERLERRIGTADNDTAEAAERINLRLLHSKG